MHKKLAAVFILFFIIACVVSVPANCKIPRLQACQKIDSDRPPDDPFPKDYQIAIKAHLRETLNDPYSIRDLKISVPEPTKIPLDDSTKGYAYFWASCISYNAKNLYGAYTGIQRYTLVFAKTKQGYTTILDQFRYCDAGIVPMN
jgi:hypothetical protein